MKWTCGENFVGKEVTFAVHKNFDDINEEEIQVQRPNFGIQNGRKA